MLNLKKALRPGLIFLLALVWGCADYRQANHRPAASVQHDLGGRSDAPAKGVLGQEADGDSSVTAAQMAGREIIYTATVRLAVDDFDSFPERLAKTALEAEGFIAEADIARMQGVRRSGRWVIRVPGSKYSSFIRTVSGLGIPESVNEKADDVTERFVDLQARIKSGRQLEEQIMKLLEKQGEKLDNLLTVERELARVRMEIEQKEGQLRLLQSQVALSTIVIHASEHSTFRPELAKSFSERISMEWQASLLRAKNTFENVVIWFAANGIALLCCLVGLYLAWIIILKRLWKMIAGDLSRTQNPASTPEIQARSASE